MNTWFEILLVGEDAENLQAAGEAALDEIERIEKLLSRFDPASEVSRINREAANSPVLLDLELAEVLETCRKSWLETEGYFDIAASRDREVNFGKIHFDPETRLISFQHPKVRIDFGGFGKGYALDCAAQLLRECGISQALLHGGTSSVLAIGNDVGDQPWKVGLRNPWDATEVIKQIPLCNNALSTSSRGASASDILNPHHSGSIEADESVSVITTSAAQAEIYSTAFLCMGQGRAKRFVSQTVQVHWTTKAPAPISICL